MAQKLSDVTILNEIDLAVGRLQPFDPAWVTTYPTFKDAARDFDTGTSLCKYGFPFHELKPTWDDGSVDVQFGGCDGEIPNCLPIEAGWNYMVSLYQPPPRP